MSLDPISSAVVSTTFKFVMNELLTSLKKKSSKFQKLKLNVEDSYRKAALVENVKTVWQIDKPVNLHNFYYPSKLILDGKPHTFTSLNDFPPEMKCVIQGTAGQGKSIFLRYLSGREIRSGDSIPLFIELRKISDKKSLEQLIIDSILDIGIDVDIDSTGLDLILSTKKISLLFDAFDEIPEVHLKDTITFIERVCYKHHHLRVVISSRPDSTIQKSGQFNVYKLAPIGPSDFRPMLEKFFVEELQTVENIISSIHKSTSKITSLITTPLLLTLLTITYKGYNKIPESPHEFYEGLFPLLAHRHDATKPGFVRKYLSGLNENQLEKLFHAYCFCCMITQKVSLTRLEAIEQTGRAIQVSEIHPISESSFISDCVKNTCLIIEEGSDFHFIHKSIREYHAARFIREADIELKRKFYFAAVSDYVKYREEIKYLKEIDIYCFDEFFLIPTLKNILNYFKWDGQNIDLTYRFGHDCTIYCSKGESNEGFSFSGLSVNGNTPMTGYLGMVDLLSINMSSDLEEMKSETIEDILKTEKEISTQDADNNHFINPDNVDFSFKAIKVIDLFQTIIKSFSDKCKEIELEINVLEKNIEDRKKSISMINF